MQKLSLIASVLLANNSLNDIRHSTARKYRRQLSEPEYKHHFFISDGQQEITVRRNTREAAEKEYRRRTGSQLPVKVVNIDHAKDISFLTHKI